MVVESKDEKELESLGADELYKSLFKVKTCINEVFASLKKMKEGECSYEECYESEEYAALEEGVEELAAALSNFATLDGDEEDLEIYD